MAVRIKCSCGKVLSIRDELRGKAVKCPGCGKVLRVPATAGGGRSSAAKPSSAATASPKAAPAVGAAAKSRPVASGAGDDFDSLEDLFEEEGLNRTVAAVCPACRSEMAAGAVICTKCGFNKQTGQKMQGHLTPGVDIDRGTLALRKAESDMRAAQDVQDRMLGKSGMPWWMLGLVLFILVGGVGVLTLAVNASKQLEGEGGSFDVKGSFLVVSGVGFYLVGFGASVVLIVRAFQKSLVDGLLYILVPFYALYFCIRYWGEVWKPFLLAIIGGGIGAGLTMAGMASLGGG